MDGHRRFLDAEAPAISRRTSACLRHAGRAACVLDEKRDLVVKAARKAWQDSGDAGANQAQAQQWKEAGVLLLSLFQLSRACFMAASAPP